MKPTETSRDTLTKILQRVAVTKQTRIAEHLEWSEAKASRVVAGEAGVTLEEFSHLLPLLGLALVETGESGVATISADELQALRTLARKALS
ncbi:MAG: hypothetical protein EVA65_15760 [Oceanococcus sp.]|nr:MAG: hypothetical protein EVA65_15760 [Oceanococcus sp.]